MPLTDPQAAALASLLETVLPLQEQIATLQAALAPAVAVYRASGGACDILSALDDGEMIQNPLGGDPIAKERILIVPFEAIVVRAI